MIGIADLAILFYFIFLKTVESSNSKVKLVVQIARSNRWNHNPNEILMIFF